MKSIVNGGDGGIRTLGTLLGYAHLANECLQPLGHVSEALGAWRRCMHAQAGFDKHQSSIVMTGTFWFIGPWYANTVLRCLSGGVTENWPIRSGAPVRAIQASLKDPASCSMPGALRNELRKYEAGLCNHDSLTIWITDDAIVEWHPKPRTARSGRPRSWETALMTGRCVWRRDRQEAKCKGDRSFRPGCHAEPNGRDTTHPAKPACYGHQGLWPGNLAKIIQLRPTNKGLSCDQSRHTYHRRHTVLPRNANGQLKSPSPSSH